MLTFEFDLASEDEDIDGLSRGHIAIHGPYGSTSSKGGSRNESVMIFLSVIELLDGIRRFFLQGGTDEYNFVGAGSSFQFFVRREKGQCIIFDREKKKVDDSTQTEFVQAVWNGVTLFMSMHGHQISEADAVSSDLSSSIEEFKQFLSLR